MKKIILISFLFITSLVIGQEDESNKPDYNRFSVELSAGLQKNGKPATDGYFTATPSFGQYGLGFRYMLNNRFGLRLGLGMNRFENADNSLPFKTNYYRGSLEGVMNLYSLLNMDSFGKSFGVLLHGGVGYSVLMAKEPVDKGKDQMLHAMVGLSPQIKLGRRVALTTDISFLTHIRQHRTWDGVSNNPQLGVGGNLVNLSAGLTIYLGKHENHADWVADSRENMEMVDYEERLAKIETDLIDSDQDGVPDYLDREPNTVSGVTVDTKGRAVDTNGNGIPDELETSLNRMYAAKSDRTTEETDATAYSNAVKHLLDNGYVNVYFQFNSDQPEVYSLDAINYLVKYMKENPSANAELIGYADELGDAGYNQKLSERRAKKVYDILIATGVEPSRVSFSGGGQDTSVDKSSAGARQLVRRVTFKLK